MLCLCADLRLVLRSSLVEELVLFRQIRQERVLGVYLRQGADKELAGGSTFVGEGANTVSTRWRPFL